MSQVPEVTRGIGSLVAGATGGCELLNMSAENQSQVLCKNRMHSYPLSLLSGPRNHSFIAGPQSLLAPTSNLVPDSIYLLLLAIS